MLKIVESQLKAKYPDDVIDKLIESYLEVKNNFYLGKFKPGELEGGFFVECVRRIIDLELFNKTSPIGSALPPFNDSEMKRYENATGDEAFRLHIPRVLRSIYNIRNKRGVGHLALVSPNIIDCTYIVASCDWVMAELLRQVSTLPPDECQKIVDSLVQRKLPFVFEDGDIQRVLDIKLSKKDQVLVLLYHNSQPIEDVKLFQWVEYSNISVFRSKVLNTLHVERLIEYRKDGFCILTPKGIAFVENSILTKIERQS